MRVAVIFHRLGPYHHARLHAAAKRCELTAIELSAVDETYAWEKVAGSVSFERITLFDDADVTAKSKDDLKVRLVEALNQTSPHVVFLNGWSDRAALLALSWCRQQRVPCVVMSDSTEWDEPRLWWREKVKSAIVQQCHAGFVAGTPHLAYLSKLGIPRERIFTGYDVVDNDYFALIADKVRTNPDPLRTGRGLPDKFFLGSNRFIPKKNLDRLIRAYAAYYEKVGSQAWPLVILGDGELRPTIETLIDELELTERVLLPGFKQYDELPTWYGLASAFVHASTTEQWGLVINEAMTSGLPVLVSERCGCAADLVQEGVNGFTFDPYDVDALTKLLIKISSEEVDIQKMGQASKKIISRWAPDVFAANMLKCSEVAMQLPIRKQTFLERALLRGVANR